MLALRRTRCCRLRGIGAESVERIVRHLSLPHKIPQRIQRFAHERISRPLAGRPAIPRALRALLSLAQPIVRRGAARLIGRGFLPERPDLAVIDRP